MGYSTFEEVTIEYIGDEDGRDVWEVNYTPEDIPMTYVAHVELAPITPTCTNVYTDYSSGRDYMGRIGASSEGEFLTRLAALIETYWDKRHKEAL